MLHTKFRENRPAGSREEDFWRVFTYMGVAAILVMWPRCREQTFVPLSKETPHKIWLSLAKWFLRRRCLSIVDRRRTTDDVRTWRTDGRTPDHWYTISSPMSLRLRWAKKQKIDDIECGNCKQKGHRCKTAKMTLFAMPVSNQATKEEVWSVLLLLVWVGLDVRWVSRKIEMMMMIYKRKTK